MGAVTTELLARARGARDAARADLTALRADLRAAQTAQAVIAAELSGLAQRVDDVLRRLDARADPR